MHQDKSLRLQEPSLCYAPRQEPNDEAVRRLLADSERNRSRHLDFRLRQQRRAKEAARKLSRRWFVDIDAWLSGATADDTTPAAFPGAFQVGCFGQLCSSLAARLMDVWEMVRSMEERLCLGHGVI